MALTLKEHEYEYASPSPAFYKEAPCPGGGGTGELSLPEGAPGSLRAGQRSASTGGGTVGHLQPEETFACKGNLP